MEPEIKRPNEDDEFFTPERCLILEVANDEADEAASIARARVEPGVTTQWHVLRDTEERYVIVSGHGRMELEGMEPESVGPGDVVIIPADVGQRITNTEEQDLIFYCVCTPRFRPESYVSRPDLEES